MTRVCAYIRQSDDEGHKKDLSCPAQEERFLRDVGARQEAGEIVEYELAPWDQGKSGGDWDRPGLQWVLANLDRFDEVWVYDRYRLARHSFFGPAIMNELRNRDVRLWCSTGDSDESTPMGRFITDIDLRLGALYREQVAERTKMNRDHRLRQGYWSGHAPTGYVFTDEKDKGSRRILVPGPDAEQMRSMFNLLAAGESQHGVCRLLGMVEGTVAHQRTNPIYIGLVYKHRKNLDRLPEYSYAALWALAHDESIDWLYPGKHEALISEPVWDAVQRLQKRGSNNRVSERLGLSGGVRCGACGGVLRVHRNTGNRHPSLRCDRCRWERSYVYVEHTVLTGLHPLTASPGFERALEAELQRGGSADPESEHLEVLRKEKTSVDQRIDRALDLLLDCPDMQDSLHKRITTLEARKRELRMQIEDLTTAVAARNSTVEQWRQAFSRLVSTPVEQVWRAAKPAEQRKVLVDVFDMIDADRDGMRCKVNGLEPVLEVDWQQDDVCYLKVAGPGIEPGTP